MTYDNPDEIIEELFGLFPSRYQIGFESQMRESDFIFYCVANVIKWILNGGFIYWFLRLDKKNPKNDNCKRFTYAAIIALCFEEIKKDP